LLADAKGLIGDTLVNQQQNFLLQRHGLHGARGSRADSKPADAAKSGTSLWGRKGNAPPSGGAASAPAPQGRLLRSAPTGAQLEKLIKRVEAADSRHVEERKRAAGAQPQRRHRAMSTFGAKILEALGEEGPGGASPGAPEPGMPSSLRRFGPLTAVTVDFERLGFVREAGDSYTLSLACAGLSELRASLPQARCPTSKPAKQLAHTAHTPTLAHTARPTRQSTTPPIPNPPTDASPL
jgi:hypothetical protein